MVVVPKPSCNKAKKDLRNASQSIPTSHIMSSRIPEGSKRWEVWGFACVATQLELSQHSSLVGSNGCEKESHSQKCMVRLSVRHCWTSSFQIHSRCPRTPRLHLLWQALRPNGSHKLVMYSQTNQLFTTTYWYCSSSSNRRYSRNTLCWATRTSWSTNLYGFRRRSGFRKPEKCMLCWWGDNDLVYGICECYRAAGTIGIRRGGGHRQRVEDKISGEGDLGRRGLIERKFSAIDE